MKRLSPHQWMALGLLLISLSIAARAIGPGALHSDLGDLCLGLLMGIGLGVEIMGLLKMRRR